MNWTFSFHCLIETNVVVFVVFIVIQLHLSKCIVDANSVSQDMLQTTFYDDEEQMRDACWENMANKMRTDQITQGRAKTVEREWERKQNNSHKTHCNENKIKYSLLPFFHKSFCCTENATHSLLQCECGRNNKAIAAKLRYRWLQQ